MTRRVVSELIESNVFVLTKENECIIVDAGASIKKVADVVDGKKVLGIFLTHGHYDHSYNALDYSKEFDCKIFCSSLSRNYLKNPEWNYSDGKLKVENFSQFEFLNGQGSLKIGEFEIFYHQLGGHSLGDMCFQVDDEIFVGDVLIGRDVGRMDLYGGDKNEMLKSLQFLLGLEYRVMHSGHGLDNDKNTQDRVIMLWQRFLSR